MPCRRPTRARRAAVVISTALAVLVFNQPPARALDHECSPPDWSGFFCSNQVYRSTTLQLCESAVSRKRQETQAYLTCIGEKRAAAVDTLNRFLEAWNRCAATPQACDLTGQRSPGSFSPFAKDQCPPPDIIPCSSPPTNARSVSACQPIAQHNRMTLNGHVSCLDNERTLTVKRMNSLTDAWNACAANPRGCDVGTVKPAWFPNRF